jgi:general secretion pathway protein L
MAEHTTTAAARRPALRLLLTGGTGTNAAGPPPVAALPDPLPKPTPPLVAPPGVSYVPTEDVLLLCIALPPMTAAQRRASIGFAVEDRIAQPLDQVHVVPGPEGPLPGTWLVAVVGDAEMAALAPTPGALVPDVMALPVPAEGGWSVWASGDRVLVRLPDGSGFATNAALLAEFWSRGGAPSVTLFGGTLPATVPVTAEAPVPAAQPTGLDLRTGRFARRGAGLPQGARALILVFGLALAAHMALTAADLLGLGRIAAMREAELRAAMADAGQPAAGDVETALARALAARIPATTGGFLPLMAQAFAAIAPEAGLVLVTDLRYSKAAETLTLMLEAPDLATLQAVETAFAGAGLTVTVGAATTGDGGAEVQMTLLRSAP